MKTVTMTLHAKNAVAHLVSSTGNEADAKWIPHSILRGEPPLDYHQPVMTRTKKLSADRGLPEVWEFAVDDAHAAEHGI